MFFVLKTAELSWLFVHFVHTIRQEEPVELVCFYSTHKEPVFIIHQSISPYLVSFSGVLGCLTAEQALHFTTNKCQKNILELCNIFSFFFILCVWTTTPTPPPRVILPCAVKIQSILLLCSCVQLTFALGSHPHMHVLCSSVTWMTWRGSARQTMSPLSRMCCVHV